MDSSTKIRRTIIALEPEEMMRLAAILTDQDREEAYRFLVDVINGKVKCAQTEMHVPEFEGGRGDVPAHFFGKEDLPPHK